MSEPLTVKARSLLAGTSVMCALKLLVVMLLFIVRSLVGARFVRNGARGSMALKWWPVLIIELGRLWIRLKLA